MEEIGEEIFFFFINSHVRNAFNKSSKKTSLMRVVLGEVNAADCSAVPRKGLKEICRSIS